MSAAAKNNKQESATPATGPKDNAASTCKRCGTCCSKGGPSFHEADKALIESGVIPARCLYTIRKGEMAYDNVRQCLEPASSDIIKIKGKGNSWTCLFFDEAHAACTIYEVRPIECRALKCWDTAELEALYTRKRLKRSDLLADIEGLWDLITAHQERCNYDTILTLVKAIKSKGAADARQKLAEIILFDIEIRKLVISRGELDADMLDFLFGRPLSQTLRHFGLEAVKKGDKIVVEQR